MIPHTETTAHRYRVCDCYDGTTESNKPTDAQLDALDEADYQGQEASRRMDHEDDVDSYRPRKRQSELTDSDITRRRASRRRF